MASREPAPGGGAVAATTVAAAAGLVAMAARFSEAMEGVETIIGRADELRSEVCELAERDTRSYVAVLEAYRLPRDDAGRRAAIRSALTTATDVPLAIVGCARQVGELGVLIATDGNVNLRGDAVTAVILAEAAARSAAHLVRLNVELGELGTDPVERAVAGCAALRQAVQTVEEAA